MDQFYLYMSVSVLFMTHRLRASLEIPMYYYKVLTNSELFCVTRSIHNQGALLFNSYPSSECKNIKTDQMTI